MNSSLFDFYSNPVTNPLYLQIKSQLGRMARFTIPIILETVHDYFEEDVPFSQALINNIMEKVEPTTTINKDGNHKRKSDNFTEDEQQATIQRPKRSRSV